MHIFRTTKNPVGAGLLAKGPDQPTHRPGVATDLDVAEAAAQVAAIESRLPALEQRQSQLINALSLLMGEPPQALSAELSTDAPVPQTPRQVAIGLPSQLAERRPDIRQAEARLHAATASIGVAKGDFYPRITLSGNIGSQTMKLGDFGSWGSRSFGIGPQFSLPLFDGGRLRGVLHLREAQQQEAAIAYQQPCCAPGMKSTINWRPTTPANGVATALPKPSARTRSPCAPRNSNM